ncbi:hypothetical protein [Patiriisocius marinus]|uniref:Uncharacterized protein n=1 Tax=Patiriisocius marinus TaxID=1397112 RepID=A0A5J4J082_9FLAO|nr:hypothetical protein [Patiriisocius marinus]GER59251.1 hypothetical protein ULMA_13590 [Patiriisocius marinus]
MENTTPVSAKKKAVIGYITIIGLFIAMSMNSDNKDGFTTRHLQNMFGFTVLWICSQVAIFYINTTLGDILWLMSLVLIISQAIRAYQAKEPNIPFLSRKFQQWFTFLA